MTTKQLKTCVSVEAGLTPKAANAAVDAVFKIIAECLEEGEEVSISNFGKLTVKTRAARKTRNPSTGEEMVSPEKKVVKFKASKVLLESVE